MNDFSEEWIHLRKRIYKRYQTHFLPEGFTYEIACELIPITQLRVWDMFGLFCCAKRIPDGGIYLEIGSKWGGSLLCVLRASQVMNRRIKMIAIEPRLTPRLCRFSSRTNTQLIKATSDNAVSKVADDSIDMLFIDGPHTCEQVSKDLNHYWPKIKVGGLVTGHDYEKRFPGVIEAVQQFFGKDYRVLRHSTIFLSEGKTNA